MTLQWKSFVPRSLRYQLLVRILLILSFILFIIGCLQYIFLKNFLFRNETATLEAKLMSIPINLIINNKSLPKPPVGDNPDLFVMSDYSLALIQKDGQYKNLLGKNGLAVPELSKSEYQHIQKQFLSNQKIDSQIVKDAKGNMQLIVFRPVAFGPPNQMNVAFNGILQMGISIAHLQHVLIQQLLTFVILSVVALGSGLAMYLSVIRKTLNPLSIFVDTVKKIDAANLTKRLPSFESQEEIARLSVSFNEMLRCLEVSFEHEKEAKEQMRRFIADASHELRTPLTSINGYLEVILRGAVHDSDQLHMALKSMHSESKRIIRLVEELLLLAKLDRTPELNLKNTELTKLIYEMKPQLDFFAGERAVCYDLTEGISGIIDADKFKQVILNLFYNAVQHTDKKSGEIKLTLATSNSEVILSIQDNGLGISEEERAHIFDRFYRIEKSRTRQFGGAGLGLSITKSIIEAHGGKVQVNSQEGQGSNFIVYLPLRDKDLSLE